jgi:hypothetical protein
VLYQSRMSRDSAKRKEVREALQHRVARLRNKVSLEKGKTLHEAFTE